MGLSFPPLLDLHKQPDGNCPSYGRGADAPPRSLLTGAAAALSAVAAAVAVKVGRVFLPLPLSLSHRS